MGVHLIGVYLTGVHLMGVYLMGVHLMGVYLTGVHLMSVHLINVHLMGVHLIDVYLTDVHMSNLIFQIQKGFWENLQIPHRKINTHVKSKGFVSPTAEKPRYNDTLRGNFLTDLSRDREQNLSHSSLA